MLDKITHYSIKNKLIKITLIGWEVFRRKNFLLTLRTIQSLTFLSFTRPFNNGKS